MTRKLIEQMLECIEELRYSNTTHAADTMCDSAITVAREYLAQPERLEPVAWSITYNGAHCGNLFDSEFNAKTKCASMNEQWPSDKRVVVPLYTQPKAPEPLTDEEIDLLITDFVNNGGLLHEFARAVLAAQRSKE